LRTPQRDSRRTSDGMAEIVEALFHDDVLDWFHCAAAG
jgi:hypothetical protein